jgi:hypothetical protein
MAEHESAPSREHCNRITRRAALRSAPAIGAVALLPAGAAVAVELQGDGGEGGGMITDPHLAWWAELQRIDVDPAPADVLARITELENLIAETPPRTLEGAKVIAKALLRYQDALRWEPPLDYDAAAGRSLAQWLAGKA